MASFKALRTRDMVLGSVMQEARRRCVRLLEFEGLGPELAS